MAWRALELEVEDSHFNPPCVSRTVLKKKMCEKEKQEKLCQADRLWLGEELQAMVPDR